MWLEILLFIGLTLAGIGLIVYNIVITQKTGKIKGIRENAPRLKNFSHREFTNGHFEGIVLKDLPRKNGCNFIEFQPTDFETGENKKRPAVQSYVCKKSNIRRSPRGELSPETEQMFTIPKDFIDLPESLRGSSLGNWMEENSMKAFLDDKFGNRTKESMRVAGEVIEETTEIGMTQKFLARLREQKKELDKLGIQNQPKEEEKKA